MYKNSHTIINLQIPFDTPSKAAHQKDPLHDTVPLDAYTQDLNEELNKELIYDE